MSGAVYNARCSCNAIFEPHEGEISQQTITVTFAQMMNQIIIVNTSNVIDLAFKFKSADEFGTLGPGEQISVDIRSQTAIIRSYDNLKYKVWGFG
tara:strand:- start:1275 stop:1559 length:285 start_codon:yes stop_codon:yes gene_type:complete